MTEEEAELTSSDLDNIEIEVVGSPAAARFFAASTTPAPPPAGPRSRP